ncbi:MAG: ankyrin repeat domain-containing protein [Nitrososphaerales archaeon]
MTFSTSELFSRITDKKARALLTAIDVGYFRVPRRSKFEDMAKIGGVPRTTFETHVRKAESKILEAMAPYISVHFKQIKQETSYPARIFDNHLTAESFYPNPRKERKEVKIMVDEYFKAIKQGEIAKVDQMVGRNSNLVNSRNESGMSGVIVATYYGQKEIARLLVSKGAILDIFEASMVGELDSARRHVEKDKNLVNEYSSDGFTALHLAAFFGQLEVAKFLIAEGANVNAVAKNMMKVAPLHSAVARSQLEISELLLQKGADANAKQETNFTPLHAAAQNGNVAITELLLKYGADMNARTEDGKTPLRMTREEGPEAGKKEGRQLVAEILTQRGGIE